MMHLVPSCSPHPPTFDASQLDFDLDLLPGFNDCQVVVTDLCKALLLAPGALSQRQPRPPVVTHHVLARSSKGRPQLPLLCLTHLLPVSLLAVLALLPRLQDGKEGVHSLLRTSGG